jgi:hypothetical protein
MDGHPAWEIGLSSITNRNTEVFGGSYMSERIFIITVIFGITKPTIIGVRIDLLDNTSNMMYLMHVAWRCACTI